VAARFAVCTVVKGHSGLAKCTVQPPSVSPVWQLSVSQQYHYFVTGDIALLLALLVVSRLSTILYMEIEVNVELPGVQVELDVTEKLLRFAVRCFRVVLQ